MIVSGLFAMLFIALAYADPGVVVRTIAYEASGESIEGMTAVASVIKQRAIDRNLTPEAVVLQAKQFSCWDKGKPTQSRKLKPKEITAAVNAWSMAEPEGFNHYCRYDAHPSWAAKAKESKRIGNHIFYNL
jgi:spore germination cell wall hydrolase CwlJ-like protein